MQGGSCIGGGSNVNKAVASNCLRVIKDLQASKQLGDKLHDPKRYLISWEYILACEIGHERRTYNVEVHRLARMATSFEVGRHDWLSNPLDNLYIPLNITI